jgi:hypothetical protein
MNVTTWEHQGICSSLESYGGPSNWVVLTFIPRLHCYCSIWHYHVSGTWTLSFTYLHTQQARRIEPHLWSHRPFVPHADNGKSRLDTGLWQGQRVVAAKELLPPKMLEPLGHPVTILTFDDTVVPSCSHSGILLFVQNSPILWLSWQQNTVETSMFGSEFVTLRTAHDMIIALRY